MSIKVSEVIRFAAEYELFERLELVANIGIERNGDRTARGRASSEERLKFLARTFRHAVWLNPQAESTWG